MYEKTLQLQYLCFCQNPLEVNPAEGKKIQHQYQYLVAQLDLFGKLCKGNNASAVETIDVVCMYKCSVISVALFCLLAKITGKKQST